MGPVPSPCSEIPSRRGLTQCRLAKPNPAPLYSYLSLRSHQVFLVFATQRLSPVLPHPFCFQRRGWNLLPTPTSLLLLTPVLEGAYCKGPTGPGAPLDPATSPVHAKSMFTVLGHTALPQFPMPGMRPPPGALGSPTPSGGPSPGIICFHTYPCPQQALSFCLIVPLPVAYT